ncbi:MAG: protein kinase [Polyangiaceae bacterium]
MAGQGDQEGMDARARAESRVGKVLKEKWRLDALLGLGGMGAVYSAIHRNQKRVAVKMLLPELSGNAEVRQRFLREGYVANTVEHPGAVSVLDDDVSEDGIAFLVMELLEGETLEARWEHKSRRLDVLEVLTWIDPLLDVLVAAHRKNIVHRDIKPENLFLTHEGKLKVLDFGIARIYEMSSTSSTRAGSILGTPAFMSPEQALAKWEDVDQRTDLWAVGATMFTLLSGKHVHEAGTGNEQLIRSATTPARSLATVTTGLPRSVIALVDRALAFERDHRWPDAQAMQEAVRGALSSLKARSDAKPQQQVPPPRAAGASTAPVAVASQALLPTADPATIEAHIAERVAESDARAAEMERLQPSINEISGRLNAARRRVAEVNTQLTQVKNERAAIEERSKRQQGTRAAGVDDARKEARRALADFGRRALEDSKQFGAEFDGARREAVDLARVQNERAHDVAVHEAAIDAYEPKGLRMGIGVGALALVLFLSALFGPLTYRSCVGVEAPNLHPAATTE